MLIATKDGHTSSGYSSRIRTSEQRPNLKSHQPMSTPNDHIDPLTRGVLLSWPQLIKKYWTLALMRTLNDILALHMRVPT